jgi:hypothetical protein
MVPQASGASANEPLMISQRMQAPLGKKQFGSWAAAGAIDDEGAATITNIVLVPVPGSDKALATVTQVLISRDDPAQMLELVDHVWVRPFPPPPPNHRVMLEGTWELVAATKAYANLRARGKLYGTNVDRLVDDKPGRESTQVRDGSARRAS